MLCLEGRVPHTTGEASKIATETTSELIKNIINTEVNNSSVSGIVEDIAKKKIDKHL